MSSIANTEAMLHMIDKIHTEVASLSENMETMVTAKVDALIGTRLPNILTKNVPLCHKKTTVADNKNTNVVINYSNIMHVDICVRDFLTAYSDNVVSMDELAHMVSEVPIYIENSGIKVFQFTTNRAKAFKTILNNLGLRRPIYYVPDSDLLYLYNGTEWVESPPETPHNLLRTTVTKSNDAALATYYAYFHTRKLGKNVCKSLADVDKVIKNTTSSLIRASIDDIIADKIYGNNPIMECFDTI